MEIQTDSERVRLSRKVVLEFLGSSVDVSLAGPAEPDGTIGAYMRALRRRSGSVRAAGRPRRPPASATTASPGHHHAPSGDASPRPSPSRQGRQRALRPRLLALHPLLQVRRGVRRGRPEHVRDRGRRARLRRPHLDRVGRRPARIGLRLLRQLHRRLPDRRPDVQARVRHARGRDVGRAAQTAPTRSVPTAASAARSTCMSRTTRS